MILLKQKSDILGTCTSLLCLAHCIVTPFLFIAQTGSAVFSEVTPSWWKFLDYLFLVISFAAVYRTTQTTTINWIKPLLWFSWIGLSVVILNEKLELIELPEVAIFFPAIALVILHLYNKKYCNCNEDKCCVDEG